MAVDTTNDTRVTLILTGDLVAKLDGIKKDSFYDKTYSDMYRELIRLGIDAMEKEKAVCTNTPT